MIEQILVSIGAPAIGLVIAWYWIKALREDMKTMRSDHVGQVTIMKLEHDEEIKCLTSAHQAEVNRIQERMDRIQERQNELFQRALRKTDLKDTDH